MIKCRIGEVKGRVFEFKSQLHNENGSTGSGSMPGPKKSKVSFINL